jgi:dihydropteroate synthase
MKRYYTRACNFYYGKKSKFLVSQKKTLPLNGNKEISFDHIEIISRQSKKLISIKELRNLSKLLKKQIALDLKTITSKKKNFSNLNFNKMPNIIGVLNLTPDSFSDGGIFNTKNRSVKHAFQMFKLGANIIDIGGESTRPGSKTISTKLEWIRINKTLKSISKKIPISLDTRNSEIMKKGIKLGVKIINDVSGLRHDPKTVSVLKKYQTPFVVQHSQGTPENMQNNPTYKNELLDIYDFFEERIKLLRSEGINHNNIIIDPGIGFGKNLKHNMNLISNISIFHTLGFPILVGNSRKRFIKELSGSNDTKSRIGGTIASSIYLMMQGVQILRIHDVNELLQAIKVFKELLKYNG